MQMLLIYLFINFITQILLIVAKSIFKGIVHFEINFWASKM